LEIKSQILNKQTLNLKTTREEIAVCVELITVNQRVAGSSPASGARMGKHNKTVACPSFFCRPTHYLSADRFI
jgi:hypothetical protein